MNKPSISFEFFPPKSDSAAENLWGAVHELVGLGPKYMTVTYGAGGSTRDGTVETLGTMLSEYDVPVGAHLTFINTPKDELYDFVDILWDMGVKHIVALRGDMPDDLNWPLEDDQNYFQYTSDFVEGLLSRHPFEISVGAYPEKHPDAPDMSADIEALRKKCDAGATRAITQFFFDTDTFLRFRDRCDKAGIDKPVVPGILPIEDFAKMQGFAKRCGATVPDWMVTAYQRASESGAEELLSISIATEMCDTLGSEGVDHFHIYTLNNPDLPYQVCQALGVEQIPMRIAATAGCA